MVTHFGAIIREWDGTLSRVGFSPYLDTVVDVLRRTPPSVVMIYSDGTRHVVTEEYVEEMVVYWLRADDLPRPNYTPPYWDVK